MTPRDKEFVKIYENLVPKLDKFFHTCLANTRLRGTYKFIKRDLIHLACCDAYLYCHKEKGKRYEIEALIWLKAEHTWWDFIRPKKSKIYGLNAIADKGNNEPDALFRILVKEQLDIIRSKVDAVTWEIINQRAEGLGYPEIARQLDEKEGRIKMLIHRLKKKLEEDLLRYYNL